jgi:uncharacterized protein (TIGR02231 family)
MRTLATLCSAFLSILAATAQAEDLPASSKIDAVTVYRSSARVTRVAHVELVAGDTRVVLAGLPAELDDDSLRVEGKGTARARVFGVTAEAITATQGASAEAQAAEARVEALTFDDQGLDDRISQARSRAKFAESLRASYSEERAKNLAVRGVSAKEWADLLGFVDQQLAGAAADVRAAEAKKRELARRLNAARAELAKLQAKREVTTKRVAVELSAERAGALELAVSYVVPSAAWAPVWDARLLPETGTVELTLLGQVSQRTGEDWADARLAVSTAEPGRGLWVPVLEPLYLLKTPPPAPRPRAMGAMAAPAAPPPMARMELKKADSFDYAAAPEPEVQALLEDVQADASMGLLAATFTAPRRESIDGAGKARTVSLAHYSLKAAITRTSAPRVDPAAYLTATLQNDTGVPLLPGTARITVGDEFVGRAPIALTPTGGELKLAFGTDGRLEVERRVLERKHETAGIVSKDEVYVYRVRTTVKNRYGVATELKLLDLLPVSRDEAIKVKLLDGSTEGATEDAARPGVKTWTLALKPKEERAVELRYEVRFPRGVAVQGLE